MTPERKIFFMESSCHASYPSRMYSRPQPNLLRPVAILIGCVLAVWPWVSASAQVVGSSAPSGSPSIVNRLAVGCSDRPHDRWDASKVEAAAPAANRGAAASASAAPAGSWEFALQYVGEKLGLRQQRLKLNPMLSLGRNLLFSIHSLC